MRDDEDFDIQVETSADEWRARALLWRERARLAELAVEMLERNIDDLRASLDDHRRAAATSMSPHQRSDTSESPPVRWRQFLEELYSKYVSRRVPSGRGVHGNGSSGAAH